jgi:hypothetical protein
MQMLRHLEHSPSGLEIRRDRGHDRHPPAKRISCSDAARTNPKNLQRHARTLLLAYYLLYAAGAGADEAAAPLTLRLPASINLATSEMQNGRFNRTHVVRMVVIWSMKLSNSIRRSSQFEKRQRS